MVRQAIEDKVTHALEVDDHEGADADLVHQAGVALGAGDLHQTRPLLERSISA